MSGRFIVICEAQADFTTATKIADRALLESVSWLDDTLLDGQRQWIGVDATGFPLTWSSIPKRARAIGIRVHGHFSGEPGLPDAQAARRAIAYVRRQVSCIDAILLIRDADDDGDRLNGLDQARQAHAIDCTIVIGVAIPEREAWVISGFEPKTVAEQNALDAEIQALGWDPRIRSHELTAGKDDSAPKSPKRVLCSLTSSIWHRQRECWQFTPLQILRERGRHNGLLAYLDDVQAHLAKCISSRRA